MGEQKTFFLDAEGNVTSKENAVEVVTCTYDDSCVPINASKKQIGKADSKADQGSYGLDQGHDGEIVKESDTVASSLRKEDMWICPNDETINTGEQCIICGYTRPKTNKDSLHQSKIDIWVAALVSAGAIIVNILLIIAWIWVIRQISGFVDRCWTDGDIMLGIIGKAVKAVFSVALIFPTIRIFEAVDSVLLDVNIKKKSK